MGRMAANMYPASAMLQTTTSRTFDDIDDDAHSMGSYSDDCDFGLTRSETEPAPAPMRGVIATPATPTLTAGPVQRVSLRQAQTPYVVRLQEDDWANASPVHPCSALLPVTDVNTYFPAPHEQPTPVMPPLHPMEFNDYESPIATHPQQPMQPVGYYPQQPVQPAYAPTYSPADHAAGVPPPPHAPVAAPATYGPSSYYYNPYAQEAYAASDVSAHDVTGHLEPAGSSESFEDHGHDDSASAQDWQSAEHDIVQPVPQAPAQETLRNRKQGKSRRGAKGRRGGGAGAAFDNDDFTIVPADQQRRRKARKGAQWGAKQAKAEKAGGPAWSALRRTQAA